MKMQNTMLRTEYFLRESLTPYMKPALHDWQSKHSVLLSLFQRLQSLFFDDPPLFFVHVVIPPYTNPHSLGGLQQPDCNLYHYNS